MKKNFILLTGAALFSLTAFAQKNEIKAAEKALKNGNADEALQLLTTAEGLLTDATMGEKAYLYFVRANAFLDLANKNVDIDNNLSKAANAYQTVVEAELASKKNKYSEQSSKSIVDLKYKLINKAIENSKVEKHIESGKNLLDAYNLDKKDTLNLYYAASSYLNGKDYDSAIKYYRDLKNMNYTGKGVNYFAVSKINSNEDLFPNKADRDKAVKFGTHEKPREEVVPSKKEEIYRNIALILVQQGKTQEAISEISAAVALNPDDTSLFITQANLYLELKDFESYKKVVAQILEKKPNDADLVFNLGVISANSKNAADAEKYYLRTMEIDPKYINAYINLAALKLESEKAIIDEMNKLGNSEKDMKKYNVLKGKREALFKSIIPYLKKAVEIDPKNTDIVKTLINVYNALEMTSEAKALKATL